MDFTSLFDLHPFTLTIDPATVCIVGWLWRVEKRLARYDTLFEIFNKRKAKTND